MIPDDLDLSRVTTLNSPDIHGWSATAQITRLDLRPDGVHVEFTKQTGSDRWPDVPFGKPGDSLQYTLWIVLEIASSWWAAGVVEFWFGLDANGGGPADYAKNWYYDPIRWTPMTGHQPAVGERVGFLVTPGDARHGTSGEGLPERSNIVAVAFPPASGGSFTWPLDPSIPAPAPIPAPEPPAAPAPAPAPPAAPPLPDPLTVAFAALEADTRAIYAWITAVEARAAAAGLAHYLPANLPPRQTPD